MANTGNLDVALRVRADMEEARRGLVSLRSELESLGAASKQASAGTQQAASAVQDFAQAGATAASSVASVPKATAAALNQSATTWKQFVADRMSDYMKIENGHAGAMKRLSKEWAEYKATLSAPVSVSVETVVHPTAAPRQLSTGAASSTQVTASTAVAEQEARTIQAAATASTSAAAAARGVSAAAKEQATAITGATGAYATATQQLAAFDAANKETRRNIDPKELAGLRAELGQLVGQIDPTVAALERLDEMERKLRSFNAKGLVDSDAFADYRQRIDTSRAAVAKISDPVAGAYSALGVRGTTEIQSEIDRLQKSFATLRTSGTASARDIALAESALTAKVKALNTELALTPGKLKANTISAGQYTAAMRMLPAQMTDITVGLATGQSPLMVMLQQGGQLKDMFGGVRGAVRAVAGAVGGMIGPWTIAAAAAAGFGIAAMSAEEHLRNITALTTQFQATGRDLGADAIKSLIKSVGDLPGVSGDAAQKVVAAFAPMRQIGTDILTPLTGLVADFAAASGTDAPTAAQALAKAFEDPAAGAKTLDEQFGILNADQLVQIDTMTKAGDTAGAQRVLLDALTTALQGTAERGVTPLQRSLNELGKTFGGIMASMSVTAGLDKFNSRLANLIDKINWLVKHTPSWLIGGQGIVGLSMKAAGWIGSQLDGPAASNVSPPGRHSGGLTASASDRSDDRDSEKDLLSRTSGYKALSSQITKTKSDITNLRSELAKLDAQGRGSSPFAQRLRENLAGAEEQLKSLEKRSAGPKAKQKVDPVETAFQSEQQSLTLALAQAQQQLANAQAGVSSSTDTQTARLEAWLKVNKNALKLNDSQIAKLRDLAKATDEANAKTKGVADEKARKERITAGMADVDQALAQVEGNTVDAAAAKAEEKWRKLRADLVAEGDFAGLLKIDKLIDIDKAKAQFQDLQKQAETIFSGQSQQETSVQTEVTAGLTTEYDARQRLLALHQATAQQLSAMLPTMRSLAEQTKDPQLLAQVDAIANRVAELNTQANELGKTFGDTFQGAFSTALDDLATRTKTLGEAVRGFISDMASGMAKWAAGKLAEQAESSVMGLINGGASTAAASTGQAAAITTATATGAATMGTGITAATATGSAALSTGIIGALTTGAATLSASLASAFSLGAAQIAAAGASGSAASGASGIAGALSSVASSYADGGYTGPGGKYTPAGIVHAGEWVMPQERVSEPGAAQFLSAFQVRGMGLLRSMRGLRGYAAGGMVLPAATPYQPTDGPAAGASSTTLNNRLALNLIDDPDRIAGVLRSPAGEKAFTVLLSRNPQKFRQLLGVGGK